MIVSNPVSFRAVDLKEGFWKRIYDRNKTVSLENVRKRFEESGRFDALRFNFLKTARRPHIFFDSDVAKWMEAVAYLIEKDPEGMAEHRALCEELIDCMERAQRPDGYLNSTHQQIEPHLIFRDRGRHELYCAGHLIEAAIAWHLATGEDKFLHIMERYVDCIERAFVTEKTAAFTTPGHEEIELALFKLYRHTGKDRYRDLAIHFLTKRGTVQGEWKGNSPCPECFQDNADIYHTTFATGHAVRALYLYSAIADMVAETGDERLMQNLQLLFDDIVSRKMYITGGVGSSHAQEVFTIPYDLPNRRAYSESCCAVAMLLFAHRMRLICHSARIGHMAERVLYNHMLSSTSIDGKAFFYVNPLEISTPEYETPAPFVTGFNGGLPITERVEVFGCSCCPPNINRMLAQIGDLICYEDADGACVEQYISSDVKTAFGTLSITERYATEGKAVISSSGYTAKTLTLRIPEWCKTVAPVLNGEPLTPQIEDGYLTVSVGHSFTLSLDFHIAPRFVAANPLVRVNTGRMALTFGPVVYCLEGADNGTNLNALSFSPGCTERARIEGGEFHGHLSITLPALRTVSPGSLYFDAAELKYEVTEAKFIPYYAFANRGQSDMLVWVRRDD